METKALLDHCSTIEKFTKRAQNEGLNVYRAIRANLSILFGWSYPAIGTQEILDDADQRLYSLRQEFRALCDKLCVVLNHGPVAQPDGDMTETELSEVLTFLSRYKAALGA